MYVKDSIMCKLHGLCKAEIALVGSIIKLSIARENGQKDIQLSKQ